MTSQVFNGFNLKTEFINLKYNVNQCNSGSDNLIQLNHT